MGLMIDLTCTICGDETEVDQDDLKDAEVIQCEECGAEFPFTIVDGKIFLGPEVDGWDGTSGDAILIDDDEEDDLSDDEDEGDEGDA